VVAAQLVAVVDSAAVALIAVTSPVKAATLPVMEMKPAKSTWGAVCWKAKMSAVTSRWKRG
jgi:hypothetical protein